MDRLDAYRILQHVADLGSFTKAAKATGLTQPRVSKIVRELEKVLGAQLLIRSTRRVALTEDGRRFLDRVKEGVGVLEEAEAVLRGNLNRPHGMLKITAPVGFGQHCLFPVLKSFLEVYPEASASLDLTDVFEDLTLGGFDLAVRIGSIQAQTLRVVRIGECPMRVVASPRYLEAHGKPTHPSDLERHQCLAYESWRDPTRWRLRRGGRMETVNIRGRFRSTHLPSLRDAVLSGMGIANLPGWLVDEDLAEKTLVSVCDPWSVPEIDIHAVLPPGRNTPIRTRVFIQYLRDKFGSEADGAG